MGAVLDEELFGEVDADVVSLRVSSRVSPEDEHRGRGRGRAEYLLYFVMLLSAFMYLAWV